MQRYVQTVIQEIQQTKVPPGSPPLSSVFLGGGTPSLVPPHLVALLLEALAQTFRMAPDAEISMEMDPGTFDRAQLDATLALGVNRVSLGVQSFDQAALDVCGRSHGVEQVREALGLVTRSRANWSLDLISSLPHQTVETWRDSLRQAIEANPHHISIYDLQVCRKAAVQ